MNYFWVNDKDVRSLVDKFETPFYLYDERILREKAEELLSFPNAFGLTVRYAMKANSNAWILKYFHKLGLEFDASSAYEVKRAMLIGIAPVKIMLTAQELPSDLPRLIRAGIRFNATSLHQLKRFAAEFPGASLGVRINPGIGSGHNKRTNVGGRGSSFGIWHEYIDEVKRIAEEARLKIYRIHIHIGSGSDPSVWHKTVDRALEFLEEFPDVEVLNLGGGFIVARNPGEKSAILQDLGQKAASSLKGFFERTGRRIKLEIEPGTWAVAMAGIMVSEVNDIVDTGAEGHKFHRLNAGMSELTRPALYGTQHPMKLIRSGAEGAERRGEKVVIVGHCCESGDLFTPQPGDPENFQEINMPDAEIGDLMLFGAAGAYCASMSFAHYNSFPRVAEILRTENGEFKLIRRRESLQQMLANEILE